MLQFMCVLAEVEECTCSIFLFDMPMRERIYRTEALILRRRDFGEADRLLIIATPAGKRRVIAKAVRKTTSRIAGHIELFTHTSMLLAIGRNLDIVTQSQVLNVFSTLHAQLPRLSRAYYVTDLYDTFTQDEEENQPLFQLLVQTFAALDTTRNPDLVLRVYELRLLHSLGYRPQFHRCAVCHELLTTEADHFSPVLGGMVCSEHASTDRNALPLHLHTFKLLRYLQNQPWDGVEHMSISAEVQAEAELLLRAYISHTLDRELKSVAFLESLRGMDNPPVAVNH